MTDFADRPIPVISRHLNNHRYAPRTITLESNLFVTDALEFACSSLNGTLDIVSGHVLSFGCSNCRPETWITVRIAATTLRRNRDLFDQSRKGLSSLGVESTLFMLDSGPL